MLQLARAEAVSRTVTIPIGGEPSALWSELTWISRKSPGVPTPPLPDWLEPSPSRLSPAVVVMFWPITSMLVGSVPRTPPSLSASRIAAGESSVTSPRGPIAGAPVGTVNQLAAEAELHGGEPVHAPVDWIWPTRRSLLVSASRIEP